MSTHNEGKKRSAAWRSSWLLRGGIIVLVLAAALSAAYAFAAPQPDRIMKRVSAGSVDLGGKTREEATTALNAAFDGLRVSYEIPDAKETIELGKAQVDGVRIASLHAKDVAERAYKVGRSNGRVLPVLERLRVAVIGGRVPVSYEFNQNTFKALLSQTFDAHIDQAADAAIAVKISGGKGEASITPEQPGWTIDYGMALQDTDARLAKLDDSPVEVEIRNAAPVIRAADLESLKEDAVRAALRGPITVKVKGETWTISQSLLADWITAVKKGGAIALSLDADKVGRYVESRGTTLSTEPKDAVFEMKDGKVVKFEPEVDGEKIDVEAAIQRISEPLFAEGGAEIAAIELPLTVARPEITTAESNDLGIAEVIGIGESNFMGSPKNRRHNIAVGAAAVNGTIVPPDEEFSLLKTLGTIDGTTGYLQELVIKGNKTTPEYGGGLCQIGSTAFRGALGSGLPITARQNHSYRVPYYERDGDGKTIGPGKDATIYDPAPDFRFKNDTGHHVLITTAIKGDRLTFTFWGTLDGRKAEQTDAKVYNVVAPPEKRLVPTTDLAPGVEKCTERAHVGSDAVFTYTVTYGDGEVKKTDFVSHYRPWQEVCLIGTDPSQMPPAEGAPAALPSVDAAGAAGN